MKRHQDNGLAYYSFDSLASYPDLVHGITTRHGGVSRGQYATLNMGRGLGDDAAAVEENVQRVCRSLGLRREHLVSPRQRHTANVRQVDASDRGAIYDGYDVFVTDAPDVPLLMVYADCTPVVLYDPRRHALALVHSGWRGTVLGAARSAVQAMSSAFGSRPADLVAAIGPSIGPCCYEVGDDVADAVRSTWADAGGLLTKGDNDRSRFDLWQANERWLRDSGVEQIEVSGLCTACHTDDFYSHRAEAGRTGHFAAVVGLR